jgi:hypothetical protein
MLKSGFYVATRITGPRGIAKRKFAAAAKDRWTTADPAGGTGAVLMLSLTLASIP